MMELLPWIVCLVVAVGAWLFYRKEVGGMRMRLIDQEKDLSALEHQSRSKEDELLRCRQMISELERNGAVAEARLREQEAGQDYLRDLLQTRSQELRDIQSLYTELRIRSTQLEKDLHQAQEEKITLSEGLKAELRELTARVLQDRTEALDRRSLEILTPFREDLKRFGQQFKETSEQEAKEIYSLREIVKDLNERSQQVGKEALELTRALKGEKNNKIQGNWGEMILENILSKSGLRRGEEYTLQEYIKDDHGRRIVNEDTNQRMQPDAIVHYPNGGKVIIDSKVSLNAYTSYVNSETETEQEQALLQHIASIERHISSLSDKSYASHLGDAPNFTFLFIPIEPAYLLAIGAKPSLWEDAYKKNILLINPTNLIASLRMTQDLWQRDRQDKNVAKIIEEVTKLYDKFVIYVDSFQKIEGQLDSIYKTYQSAKGQLAEGRGNLMSRMEAIRKKGGLQTKKSLTLPQEEGEDSYAEED